MTEKCEVCGHDFGVWFVASDIWNRVIPTRQGMLCPCCFIAKAGTVIDCTGWELVPENYV